MKYIISCEHATNRIPYRCRHLFQGEEGILASHRAYDSGAASLARILADRLHGSLHLGTISRLLVDLNRSPTNMRSLFSEYARRLPKSARDMLLREYYLPYRRTVEKEASEIISQGGVVLHFSIHSFSPVKGTKKRNADIGLLYDPGRKGEKNICAFLKTFLYGECETLRVRMNYPYRGKADGFTGYMRKHYKAEQYVGVEIEINQSLLLSRGRRKKQTMDALVRGAGEIDKYFRNMKMQKGRVVDADKRYGILG
jgi:predicted N-formylglutamate amidohydrolase